MLDFYSWVEDLEIELSTKCNAKCPLCFRNNINFKHSNVERNFNEVIKQLENFKNVKFLRLVGTVSEPTLYSKFLDICKWVKENKKWKIEICTNGDTNDYTFWSNLGKILDDNDKVYFTICGSTQEIHEIYRRNTKLTNILKNAETLRNFRKIDYAQIIRFSYNSDNLDSDEFKNLIQPFTFKYYTETFLQLDTKFYKEKDNLKYLKTNPKKESLYMLALRINKNDNSKCYCKAFENKWGQLDINGDFYPCYRFLEFSDKKFDLDYNKIFDGKYASCQLCRSKTYSFLSKNNLEYII